MKVDKALLDELTAKSKASPRLRMNLDMRTTPADTSQRMLNALEPGIKVPIHPHTQSTETVTLLRGSVRLLFFDEQGRQTSATIVETGSSCPFYFVPQGLGIQWSASVPEQSSSRPRMELTNRWLLWILLRGRSDIDYMRQ